VKYDQESVAIWYLKNVLGKKVSEIYELFDEDKKNKSGNCSPRIYSKLNSFTKKIAKKPELLNLDILEEITIRELKKKGFSISEVYLFLSGGFCGKKKNNK